MNRRDALNYKGGNTSGRECVVFNRYTFLRVQPPKMSRTCSIWEEDFERSNKPTELLHSGEWRYTLRKSRSAKI